MKRSTEHKQKQIIDFITSFLDEHGYPPSVREIGAAVGLLSPSTVHSYLKKMHERGLIQKDDNKTRAISITDKRPKRGVRVLGKVTAGQPILAFEDECGLLSYEPQSAGDYFALSVKGDSMINAGIFNGDFVVVRKQPVAEHGDIVVALIDDEATVKRLVLKNDKIILMPENPAYDPIDGNNCEILGKVTTIVREL